MKDFIRQNLINKNGKLNPWSGKKSWWESKKWLVEYHQILQTTKFLEPNAPMQERVYCIMHDLLEVPLCEYCKKSSVKYHAELKGYAKTCSAKCGSLLGKASRERTNIQKYGYKYNFQSPEFVQQAKKTKLQKYGTLAPNRTTSNPFEITGIDSVPSKYFRKKVGDDTYNKLLDPEWLTTEHIINQKSINQIACELGINASTLGRYYQQATNQTPVFHAKSQPEKEICSFVQDELGMSCVQNDRTHIAPLEIDILVNENIAIEFCGCYWHNSSNKPKYYHLGKVRKIEQAGLKPFFIWEYLWNNKPEIYKSMIRVRCGMATRMFARNTYIKEMASKEANRFFQQTHLYGPVKNMNFCLGLYDINTDELLSVMGFGVPRFAKKYEWELIRFSTKLDTVVVGGMSKLFSHFQRIKSPLSVVSYCKKEYSTANSYQQVGFDITHETSPYYFYINKNGDILSRYACYKSNLPKLLGNNYDDSLTEFDNMKNAGYHQIFDCGSYVLAFNKTP